MKEHEFVPTEGLKHRSRQVIWLVMRESGNLTAYVLSDELEEWKQADSVDESAPESDGQPSQDANGTGAPL